MIEKITPSQSEAESAALEACQGGLSQMTQQLADDAAKKADQAMKDAEKKLNEANRKLAEIPENAMLELKKIENKLWELIAGLKDTKAPDWDGKTVVEELKKLLDPVLNGLKSLPVPEVPGLKDVQDLLNKLTELMQMTPESAGMSSAEMKKLIPQKPDLPTHLLETLKSLALAISTLCQTLPMVLINLIFDMLCSIYDMFDQIVGMFGIPPPIPPFDTIKQCPKIGKDIKDFVTNAPGKVNNVVKGVIQEKLQLIAALKHPKLPSDPPEMTVPENLPACPTRDS